MSHRKFLIPLFLVTLLLPGLGIEGRVPAPRSVSQALAAGNHPAGITPADETANQGEAGVYRVYYDSSFQLAELAASYDIWEVRSEAGFAVLALAAGDAGRLTTQGYRLEPAVEQMQQLAAAPPGYPCYRDEDELLAELQQMTLRHPYLATLVDYGDSWRKVQGLSGHDLWALKITNSRLTLPKPRFFLLANIHARELTTSETALHFARYVLEEYGSDPDVTWIVDYHEIYIVVTANPDGRELVESGCFQRKNRNGTAGDCNLCDPWGADHYGVDLNRNNPYRWGAAGTNPCGETYQGVRPASEPETYALNTLIRSIFPDQRPATEDSPAPQNTTGLLISLHSYGDLVLWPWGYTYAAAPNEGQLRTLGRKLAYLNRYTPSQSSDLYPTTGDTVDWVYGELGIPAYTFELGDFFFESCSELQGIMDENLGALLYAAKVARTPYLTPAGPDSLDLAVVPRAANAGDQVQLAATVDDTRYNQSRGMEPWQNVATAAFYIDVPPWITTTTPIPFSMAASDGLFDEAVERVQATVDTTGLSPGRHMVYVQGQDADGQWGVLSAGFLDIVGCVDLTGIEILGPDRAAPGIHSFTTSFEPPSATLPIAYFWENDDREGTSTRSLAVGTYTLMVTATNCVDALVTDAHTIVVEESGPPRSRVFVPLVLRDN